MSVYYILINKDKKEWIDSGDLGLGLKEWVYTFHITPLLGYLIMDEIAGGDTEQYDPSKHITQADNERDANFYFKGHWNGDKRIELVSEYGEEYDICHGYEQDYKEETIKWVNITIPLAKDWNHEVMEMYGDSPTMQDWIKTNTYKV